MASKKHRKKLKAQHERRKRINSLKFYATTPDNWELKLSDGRQYDAQMKVYAKICGVPPRFAFPMGFQFKTEDIPVIVTEVAP